MLRRILLSTLLAIFPLYCFADVTIQNNTQYYGTAKTTLSPCSSSYRNGILKPYGSITIPQSVLNTFCNVMDCEANLYMNNSCNGKVVGVVKVNGRKGIISVIMLDRSKVTITGNGQFAMVNPR